VEIKPYLERQRQLIDEALNACMLRPVEPFSGHIEAMRYSLFVGGKRVRPILCLAAARAVSKENNTDEKALPVACALECIHTYSLIHDDLPAMDNDDLRRGKPTNHKVFGEAAAILAGDGLLTLAFDLLSNPERNNLSDNARLRIINTIARAAGPLGMVGGQQLDIENEGKTIDFPTLQAIHRSKTGALITASLEAGGIAGGADPARMTALGTFGSNIGLAFQIVDDLLNVESTTEQLGKSAGSDAKRGKATYPAFFGIEETRNMARAAVKSALDSLAGFDNTADPLRELAHYIVNRKR
jgi:geranylgeranyl diphosphate synthase type II